MSITDFAFLSPIVSCLLVILLAIPARKFAQAIDLIDKPGGRKNHEKPVPPIGGLIIFPVFMSVALLFGVDLKVYWSFYVSLIILLTTGALDDRFSLPAWIKFFTHFTAAALIVVWGGCQVSYLGNLFGFGVIWASFMTYPFSIIAVVLLINAVNLMDGIDGLAGGKTLVMFSFMAIAAYLANDAWAAYIIFILIGAISGFLIFNMRSPFRRRASMFLGDSGSMCLGLAIAWFAIHLAKGESSALAPISVAWIIGLPIFDACAQFYRRAREGKDPFAPDRGHLHYHFIDAKFSVTQTTFSIMAVVAFMSLVGFGGYKIGVPEYVLTALWIIALFLHIYMSYKPEEYVSALSKLKGLFFCHSNK